MKAYAGLVAASSLLSLTAAASNTVHMQIVKNREVEHYQLRKRATVSATLGNTISLYYANVTVGTPAQALALQVDTGSSDVWLPSSSATICTSTRYGGCPDGSFDRTKSSTYTLVGRGEFNISYVDGSGSSGDYFQDTFTIGGKSLSKFEMGLATSTTVNQGIAGIAFSNSEAGVYNGNGKSYPNLVESMVNASLIPSQAYSLWLDDLQASSGSLLFGGIDTNKYHGSLTSLQLYPDSRTTKQITSFTVAFTGLSATSPTGTDQLTANNYVSAAILDSGTTLTLLPDEVATIVFKELGATYNRGTQEAIVPCNLANINGTLNFAFGGSGGAVIRVPVSELVIEPLTDSRGRPEYYTNGNAACILGIQPAGNRPVLFGDTFLRSAYVVYDLANNMIAVAQTNFDSTGSNIVEFASKGAAIPSATTAPNQPTGLIQTATGIVGNGGSATATGAAESASITQGATGTGAAVAGFASATNANAASGTGKSAAGSMPRPVGWTGLLSGAVIVSGLTIGGGLLVWL